MPALDRSSPVLLLGPLLRHVDPVSATVWVEVDRPCEVAVLGRRARTFRVGGHHYALVVVTGLEPGSTTPYEGHLNGERAWPPERPAFPPSRIRTPGRPRPLPNAVRSRPLPPASRPRPPPPRAPGRPRGGPPARRGGGVPRDGGGAAGGGGPRRRGAAGRQAQRRGAVAGPPPLARAAPPGHPTARH